MREAKFDIIAPTVTHQAAARRRWDAVVIGAGPSGSLAARTLALGGSNVLLVDKSRFPRPKVCGCCLSGAAVDTLSQAGLGEMLDRIGAGQLSTLRLHAGPASAELPSLGVAVSRSVLDAALIREAIRAGAAFLPETLGQWRDGLTLHPVAAARPGAASTPGAAPLAAKITLIADGLAGTALAADPPAVSPRARVGLSAVLDAPFEPGVVRMACGPSGYVGAVALEDGRLNIAAAVDPASMKAQGGPANVIRHILAFCRLESPPNLDQARWRGTPGLTRSRMSLYRPGLLIIGDAAGYVEPFTGEGIGWALAGGIAAAHLVLHGQPQRWPQAHAALISHRQRICRAISFLLRKPMLSAAAIRALSAVPRFASPALNLVHRPILETAL